MSSEKDEVVSYISKQSIKISTLTSPSPSLTSAYYKSLEENGFYPAYSANLDASKALASQAPPLYQDAWLSLNISVECFFKYLFCLVRHKIETQAPAAGHNLIDLNVNKLFLYGTYTFTKRSDLLCKDFGHNVRDLWTLIDTLTDASSNSAEFASLKHIIPTQQDWVDARYKARDHISYESKYVSYSTAFNACLTGIFGAIK